MPSWLGHLQVEKSQNQIGQLFSPYCNVLRTTLERPEEHGRVCLRKDPDSFPGKLASKDVKEEQVALSL